MLKEIKKLQDYYCNVLSELIPDQFESRDQYFYMLDVIKNDSIDYLDCEFEILKNNIKIRCNNLKIAYLEGVNLNEEHGDDSN